MRLFATPTFLRGAVLGTVLAGAHPLAAGSTEYRELVDRWLAGDDAPVADLRAWPPGRINAAGRERPQECPEACRRAGGLLHTAVALGLGDPAARQRHLRAAERHLRSADAELRREWLLSVGQGLLRWGLYAEAATHFERALRTSGTDPGPLVALGALCEMQEALPDTGTVRGPCEPAPLPAAAAYYRRALARAPEDLEARLRLGRVLAASGRGDDALAQLRLVAEARPPGPVASLAHLFEGRVHEAAGRVAGARRAYEAAAEADPAHQPAQISLARLRARGGSPDEAAAALRTALSAPKARARTWAGYHMAPADLAAARLELLRRRLRP